MSAGLPMIASDIPVFHEIAGDRALYFKPGDPAALDEAIGVLHSRCGERVRAAAEFAWPNWHEAAVDFFAKVEGRAAPAAR
jgi:glycosyltransferase involved in cell wall biosynthesis